MSEHFGPTIRIKMRTARSPEKLCALLLALVFLLAQLHFCADLNGGSNNQHFCSVCSTTAAAIATDAPLLGLAEAVIRLEIAAPQIEIATTVATSISTRAPPTL